MREALFLVPAVPLAGFLFLALSGRRLPRGAVAAVGAGTIGVSFLLALAVAAGFLHGAGAAYGQTLWTWMRVGDFAPTMGFYLDSLSLVMILVVTLVSFLIHLYSIRYMGEDEDFRRFFAYMNLFVGSMLILVLADNLLLLYLGWEGVGLCSYLLIGFWYRDPANGRAAIKAFVVTRVGDAALAVGLFLLYQQLGTLQIQDLMGRAAGQWAVGSGMAVAAAALLLGGAVGKSAQLPLQTWLPDAMAGPTPVSALIHAATMVTAGVYLIARTHVLFALAPAVMLVVAAMGAVTLVLAACSALVQHDIKRVLAYSTMSQVGYMFLGLGVGAWGAAIFHFMTHAFFKSLLFLGAGALIQAQHEDHNLHHMGGLRRRMPGTFWTFLIGAASLAAVPLVTAGFYSKDLIVSQAWLSPQGGAWLWAAAWVGVGLTAVYTFRMVFLAFWGPEREGELRQPTGIMVGPMVVLAGLSLGAGFVQVPWGRPYFAEFLGKALPLSPTSGAPGGRELALQLLSAVATILGIVIAWALFGRKRGQVAETPALAAVRRFWLEGWGFDRLYEALLVRPYVWLARVDREDAVDWVYRGLAGLAVVLHRGLSATQTGKVRWYAAGVAAGAVVLIALVMRL